MELTLFVIVGAIAIASAAMMLISENAVHSALFLIVNFGCIAFFFLMLEAPFLAMVQIAVYAGAIMVLFLFVIMLLGADRTALRPSTGFRWQAPLALVLALAFVITASAAIIRGDIALFEQREHGPMVRVAHAVDGLGPVDVYLDGQLAASGIGYGEASDFEDWFTGEQRVQVVPAGQTAASPLTQELTASVEVDPGETISLVLTGYSNNSRLIVVNEDLDPLEDGDQARLIVVNGLPELSEGIDLWDDEGTRDLLVENLPYGQASEPVEVREDTYTFGVYYPTGNTRNPRTLRDEEFKLRGGEVSLLVLGSNDLQNTLINFSLDANPTFGSPTAIGQSLFTNYVLPFELVSLLLLVAMVGAIVLTHEPQGVTPRRRLERRLANPSGTLTGRPSSPASVATSGAAPDEAAVAEPSTGK